MNEVLESEKEKHWWEENETDLHLRATASWLAVQFAAGDVRLQTKITIDLS